MENKEVNLTKTLLYIGDEGAVNLEVIIDQKNETLWTTQKAMAKMFNVKIPTINEHLKNIFKTKELDENSTMRKFRIVQKEGNRNVERNTNFYNLDVIISVGYKVNSKEATNFRIWATKKLKEYLIKGFILDDELLKNERRFNKNYFENLLEQINEIKTSQRRFDQKITDLYITSYDYQKNAKITKDFFETIQNKLIYAASGNTAEEIIAKRNDSKNPNIKLTSNKNKNEKILMSNTVISKNYLNKNELKKLNQLVDNLLNLAEIRAKENDPTTMTDWIEILDIFIKAESPPKLKNKENITSKKAEEIAKEYYKKFKVIQDKTFCLDFDNVLEEVKRIHNEK
ncbi:MAG: virulence RhuM family protein [Methanobrevibacter sp.]|jgi:hypothetical protein|nr:virulence RhuM family protein [Candidatus Methanoflexus mossambicus]